MIPRPPGIVTEIFFGTGSIAAVQQAIGPGWAPFFRVVTVPGVAWGVIAAVGLGLWLWGRASAYSLVGIVVIEALVSTLMNQIFFLPRPAGDSIVRYEHLEIGSFPSGHVFTATAIWGWLYVTRRLPFWVSGVIIALVGIARIYLGVHFVGDVVGGFLLGCGVVWVHGRVWPFAREWLARRGAGFFAALGGATMLGGVAAVTLIEPDNPYAWNGFGLMLAAPLALTAERMIGEDVPADIPHPMLSVGIGLIGLVPLLALWLSLPDGSTYRAAASVGAATLWAWGIAPALLRRLRLR